MAFIFGYSNLVVANGSTSNDVNMTADWIMVDDGNGNTLRVPMTTTVPTIKNSTQTSTMVNGRDQKDLFPASTASPVLNVWVSIWAIYNPITNAIAGLFSLSATAPTLPSGYTHKAWVGAVYNDAGGNFVAFSQRQNNVAIIETSILAGGTSSARIAIPLTPSAIPPTAVAVSGWAKVASTAANFAGYLYSTTTGQGRAAFDLSAVASGGGATGSITGNWHIVIATPQTICYSVPAGSTIDVWVTQWEY